MAGIGIFSVGTNVADPVKHDPDLLADATATNNKKMKAIWICAGDKDLALPGAPKNLDKILAERTIRHTFSTTP